MTRRNLFDAALVAIVALFAVACLFAHPAGDDFVYAANARAGLWPAWIREYVGWNGRFASNALVLATPLRYGLVAYRAAAIGVLAATVAAMFLALRAWEPQLGARDAFTAALALSAVFLCQAPSIGEAIYWYTAAATYQLWVVPAAVYLWLLLRARRARPLALVICAVLLVVLAGFNEVTMLLLVALHGLWVWAVWHRHDRERALALAMLTAIVAGGAIVFLSPGNAVRQSMYGGVRHQVGRSIAWTALQTLRFGTEWLISGPVLLGTALLVRRATRSRASDDAEPTRRPLLAIAIGLALALPVATFPAYWETGTLGQHRTVNVAALVVVALWFAMVWTWAAGGSKSARMLSALVDTVTVPLAVAFLAVLAFTGNSYTIGADLVSGRLARFDREMTERYGQFNACRSHGDARCEVMPLDVQPAAFYVLDISTDEHDWVNLAYGRYFLVPRVVSVPRPVSDVRY